MHLKANALGLTAGILTGVCYLLDAAFHYFAPELSFKFYSYISFGMDFAQLGSALTAANFVVGLVVWFVLAYVTGWLFAALYNSLAK